MLLQKILEWSFPYLPYKTQKNLYKRYVELCKNGNGFVHYRDIRKLFRLISKLELEKVPDFVTEILKVQTNEIWGWNIFFGASELLKKYAEYNGDIKCIIDHGVFIGSIIRAPEIKKQLPMKLVTSKYAKQHLERLTCAKCIPMSLHILYAKPYYNITQYTSTKTRLGKNLLVFPVHSCEWSLADYDVSAFMNRVNEIKKEHHFDSVTVCLHYLDVIMGRDKLYRNNGYYVVSAGHMFDLNFFARLRTIIALADVVVSNDIGSCLFNSIVLGKPFYLLKDESISYTNTFSQEDEGYEEGWHDHIQKSPIIKRIQNAFSSYGEHLTKEQLEIRDLICDLDEFKSPEELRRIFQEAEDLYNHGTYDKQLESVCLG